MYECMYVYIYIYIHTYIYIERERERERERPETRSIDEPEGLRFSGKSVADLKAPQTSEQPMPHTLPT